MHNLVPDFILDKLKSNKKSGNVKGAVLFVDIRGFTHMTEVLMKENDKGSEILSDIINEIFYSLVSPIHEYDGFVATFAGDAFTAVFCNDTGINVAGAALRIVKSIEKNSLKKTPLGDFEIAVKVGISAGEIEWAIVGDEDQMSYYFKGEAVDAAAEAESKSSSNEINIHSSALKNIPIEMLIKSGEDYFLSKTQNIASPDAVTQYEKDSMLINRFYKTDQMPEKFTGEFRDAASLFISFKNYNTFEEIGGLIKLVINATVEYKGYFNMIDFGDKGAKAVILFGAPVSYERNLERSIECAKAVISIDKENISAGLTHGRVFAGYVGSKDRCTYTVLGDKVNLSARMMGIADFGSLLTESAVAEEMKWKYEFREIGDVLFKGKSAKEKVFEIKSKKNLNSEELLFENEIVGREFELEKIQKIIDESLLKGKFGGVVNIYGEPGVGKSRLMYESMQRNAHQCDAVLLKNDDIYNRSLYPFEIFLKRIFNQNNADSGKKKIEEFEKEWNNICAGMPNGKAASAEDEILLTKEMLKGFLKINDSNSVWESMDSKLKLENTIFAVKEFLKILSIKKPLLLCAEDIQWQDKDSNELFKVLSRKIENYPILIITTSRYNDDGSKVKLSVEPESASEDITVGVLDLEQCEDYIAKQLIFSPSKDLVGKIYEKTDGNPFYIEQISLYLIENGILEIKNDEYCMKSDIEEIPHGINAILIARIDRLTRELKDIVQNAAVLGREFEIDVLSKMLSGRMEERYLSDGINEKIWQPLNQVKYIFKHNMMRDAAYNMQLKSRLKELHLIAAESLERIHKTEKSKYPDMAYHFEKGENTERAKYYYKMAGFDAKNEFKNYDAEKYLSSVLKFSSDKGEMIVIKLALSEVFYQMGEWHKSENIYKELIKVIEEYNDEILTAEIFLGYSELLFEKGDIEESKKVLEKASAIYEKLKDQKGTARVLITQGQILWRTGNLSESENIYKKALEIVTEIDDGKLKAEVLLTIGNIYKDRCIFDTAMEYYEKSKELCIEHKQKTGLCGTIGNMGLIEWMKGNYERAMDYFNEEMEIAKTIGSKFVLSYVYGNMGSVYFLTNKFDKAEEYFLKQMTIAEEVGEKKNIRIALNNLGAVCEMKGEYEKELDYFEKSLKIAEELNAKMGMRIVLSNIGNVYGKWGEHEKALEYFRKSLLIAEELEDKRGVSILKMNIGSAYKLIGNMKSSEEYIDDALRIMTEFDLKPNMPKALLEKAMILFVKKNYEEAEKNIELGLEILEKGDQLLSDSNRIGLLILKFKLMHKQMKGAAEEGLKRLLSDAKEESDKGDIYNALFDLTGNELFGKNALDSYNRYYASYPVKEFKDKIESIRMRL